MGCNDVLGLEFLLFFEFVVGFGMKYGEFLEEMVYFVGFFFLLSCLFLDFLDGEDFGEMV